jgi:hypothetical protein
MPMTMNCNWPRELPQSPSQQECQRFINSFRLLGRRWALLQQAHNLPERAWEATHTYFDWFCDQGWSARPVKSIETAKHSIHWHNRSWLSFAIGGAEAWVRAFDLGPGNVTTFLAGSLYVHDFCTDANDIRILHRTVENLLSYFPGMHIPERNMGEAHAAYWIEQARERRLATTWRKPPPPPLHEQPPGFSELLELHVAQATGAIQ